MASISQEQRAWEQEEYGDLRDTDLEGIRCWFCGEQIECIGFAETTVDVDGMLMWVPVCDHCDPPPSPEPPTPIVARLACPICSETLVPPRRHSCGGAAHMAMAMASTTMATAGAAAMAAAKSIYTACEGGK